MCAYISPAKGCREVLKQENDKSQSGFLVQLQATQKL